MAGGDSLTVELVQAAFHEPSRDTIQVFLAQLICFTKIIRTELVSLFGSQRDHCIYINLFAYFFLQIFTCIDLGQKLLKTFFAHALFPSSLIRLQYYAGV